MNQERQLPERRQFLRQIAHHETQQLLRLRAARLGKRLRLLRRRRRRARSVLGQLRALHVGVAENRTAGRADGEHRACRRNHPRAKKRRVRRGFLRQRCSELALDGGLALALVAHRAAGADDAAEHVVGQLHAAHIEPLLDAQQPAVHECGQRLGRSAGGDEAFFHPLLGEALAVAGVGEQLVLDERAHAGGLVGEGAFVELGENGVAGAREEVGGDFRATLREARGVEFTTDEAEERGLDLGAFQLGAAADEAHDGLRHLVVHQLAAGAGHGGERLRARHAGEPHPVLGDRRHSGLQALKVREVVFAERDENAVVGARKIEALHRRLVTIELSLERLGRAIFDEVGEVLGELRGALPAKIVALRQRENLLELIEDEQRDQRAAGVVAQHIVAVVEKFPERLAGLGDAGLRPVSGGRGRAQDGLFDLLGGRRGFAAVVEPHIHGAIALGPEPRHETGAEDGGFSEARLAEEDGEELALHASPEFGDLLVAPVEIGARLLGEGGEAQPGILWIDGGSGNERSWGHGKNGLNR